MKEIEKESELVVCECGTERKGTRRRFGVF